MHEAEEKHLQTQEAEEEAKANAERDARIETGAKDLLDHVDGVSLNPEEESDPKAEEEGAGGQDVRWEGQGEVDVLFCVLLPTA